MALKPCRECKEKVSTEAKTCPHCGVSKPAVSAGLSPLIAWGTIFGTLWFVWFLGTNPSALSVNKTRSSKADGGGSTMLDTALAVDAQKSAAKQQTPAPKRPPSAWTSSSSKDEMTGAKRGFASSIRVAPSRPMEFPYGNVKAWMGVGCSEENQWAYFGFTTSPNLNNTKTEDGYSSLTARLKWDEEVVPTQLTQEWGDKFVHFVSDSYAISRIESANNVLLELDWHGSGKVYFKFPLRGSSAALGEMRKRCGMTEV